MKSLLFKLTTCVFLILAGSSIAALAWDRSDQASGAQSAAAPTTR